jgi:hypothetical protein
MRVSVARSLELTLAASVALVMTAVGSAPAVAKPADGEFVKADCSSQVSDDWGETSTLQRIMFLSVDYSPEYRRGRPVHDHRALSLRFGGFNPNEFATIYESEEIISAVPTAARNFSGALWNYEPNEGSESFSETRTRHDVTVAGPTWVKVGFQLGRRKISLGRIEPRWFEDPYDWLESPGTSRNAAVGGLSNWQLRLPLRKRQFRQLRRHEAKGGKLRARFSYGFPETTRVVTYPPFFESPSVTRTFTYSAAKCSARSRPVTFTVG